MKHAVIVAHPNDKSFTLAMAKAYQRAAVTEGHSVVLRDLYRIPFDPCLHANELPWSNAYMIREDVAAERKLLEDADVFALAYPFWFNAPPAILKGYIDRVFGNGFGFLSSPWGTKPLLSGRRLISVSFSGAPNQWVQGTGALRLLKQSFDDHIAAVCGLTIVDHLHFGQIVPGIREDVAALCMDSIAASVTRHFPGKVRSKPVQEVEL